MQRIFCLEQLVRDRSNIDEDVLKVIYNLGLLYYNLGRDIDDYVKAFRAFEIILKNQSKFPAESMREILTICNNETRVEVEETGRKNLATYCQAIYYHVIGDYGRSIAYFDQYLCMLNRLEIEEKERIQYTTIKALYYKAKSHSQAEQFREAINSYFSQLVQIDQGNYGKGSYRTLYNIGLNYRRLDEHANSIIYFSEALLHINSKENRDHKVPWPNIDKFDENILFVENERRHFEESDTLKEIGLAYKQLGYLTKAKEMYKEIIKRHDINNIENYLRINNRPQPEKDEEMTFYYETKNYLAMAYAETGEFCDALNEIDFIHTADPKYVGSHMIDTKGYIYYKMDHFDKALEYFNKAIEKDDDQKIYFFHRGNCYLKMNKFSEAISSYKDAIALDEDYLEVLNNRAVAYYKNNEKDSAVSDLKKILKYDYRYISAHHNLLKISSGELGYRSFWNYWNDSKLKKIFATSLAIVMFALIVSTIIYPHVSSIINSQFTSNSPSVSSKTQITNISRAEDGTHTTITNITQENNPTKEAQQDEVNIATIGAVSTAILAIVLLSPIISSAKIGTTSIELTTVDRETDKKTELEFIER